MARRESIEQADDGLPAKSVGSWAEQKHELLVRYVIGSSRARAKFSKQSAYVDLYCGFGRARRRDSSSWQEGSAVVAWRASVKSRVPFAAIHICDIDPVALSACEKRLQREGAPVVAHLGAAESVAEKLSRELHGGGLHLALLDPFSLGAMPITVVQSIARVRNIDLIVHFSMMDLARNYAKSASGEVALDLDAIAPGWRERAGVADLPVVEQRERFFRHWMQLLQDTSKLPALEVPAIRNRRNGLLYRLVLASKHKLAHKIWNTINAASKQRGLF